MRGNIRQVGPELAAVMHGNLNPAPCKPHLRFFLGSKAADLVLKVAVKPAPGVELHED